MEENEGVMFRAAKSDVWKFVWRSRIFGEGTPLEVSRKAAPGHDEGRTFLSGQFYFFRSPALLRVLWCEFPLGTPWESSPCPSNRGAHGEVGHPLPTCPSRVLPLSFSVLHESFKQHLLPAHGLWRGRLLTPDSAGIEIW